jgi:hypothetical protein
LTSAGLAQDVAWDTSWEADFDISKRTKCKSFSGLTASADTVVTDTLAVSVVRMRALVAFLNEGRSRRV